MLPSVNWAYHPLSELAAHSKYSCVGGPFGSNLGTADYVYDGVPVIRGQNLGTDRWVGEEFVYVTEEKADSLTSNLAYPGDLIFTQRGTLGQVAIVPRGAFPQYLLSQSQMKVRIDPEKADSLYVYYYCSSEDAQEYLRNHTVQTGVPHINLDTLRKMPIPLPPLPVQRRIAHILGTLDDKIELNRQMNATLEATARALFRSWFVDFDPVRAKAEGREPAGMDAATAALFPGEFEESEIGEIPKGWSVGKLTDVVRLIGGGTPSTSVEEYWNGDIPWFSVVDVPPESDVFVLNTEKCITEEGLNNCSTRLLSPGTTIVTARGTVGKLALVGKPMTMNQSCYAVNGQWGDSDFYTYFLLKSQITLLQQQTHGSVFDTITRATFDSLDIVIPPETLVSHFESTIASVMGKIKSNCIESHMLAVLRDILLPRLLSGELLVTPEATPAGDA